MANMVLVMGFWAISDEGNGYSLVVITQDVSCCLYKLFQTRLGSCLGVWQTYWARIKAATAQYSGRVGHIVIAVSLTIVFFNEVHV